jgi:hypothetical protein
LENFILNIGKKDVLLFYEYLVRYRKSYRRMVEVSLSKGRKEEVGKMQSSLSNLKSESVHHSHDAEKNLKKKRYKEK